MESFNSNIIITQMTSSDLHNLKDILINEFDDFWSYSILEKEFNNPDTYYIVAKENDLIVGFAGILPIIDEANIMNIVTKKTHRHMRYWLFTSNQIN